MNATMLVRSPPARSVRGERPAPPPPRASREAGRRAWLAAFVVSALIHLLLVAVIRFEGPDRTGLAAPVTQLIAVRPAVGTRVENIAIVPEDALVERPEDDALIPRIRFDTPIARDLPVVRNAPQVEPDAAPTGARTFEELLRPGERSPELWRRTSPIHTPLDPETAAQDRIARSIDAYNDSVALASARAARAVDWTHTDDDGGRWGVSPAGIHLGDITIPVPINFSPGPGKRDEVAGRVRDWGEIQAQGARAVGDQTLEERVKAIRERKEKERAEREPPS